MTEKDMSEPRAGYQSSTHEMTPDDQHDSGRHRQAEGEFEFARSSPPICFSDEKMIYFFH